MFWDSRFYGENGQIHYSLFIILPSFYGWKYSLIVQKFLQSQPQNSSEVGSSTPEFSGVLGFRARPCFQLLFQFQPCCYPQEYLLGAYLVQPIVRTPNSVGLSNVWLYLIGFTVIYLMCLSVVSEDSNEYVGTTSYDFSVDDHNKQIKCEATTPGFDNEKMESTGTISIEGEWAETKNCIIKWSCLHILFHGVHPETLRFLYDCRCSIRILF